MSAAAQSTTGVSDARPGFRVRAYDGSTIHIAPGDWHQNTNSRSDRVSQAEGLSAYAHRVHACLDRASMGSSDELAVKWVTKTKTVPLQPADIAQRTKLSRQNVRRALEELELYGLARREADDDGDLRRGHIRIYSWANPRPVDEAVCSRARLQTDAIPSWFPPSWGPLAPLIKRLKLAVSVDEESARDYMEAGAIVASAYEKAEKEVRAFLEKVCAPRSLNKEDKTERTEEKEHTPEPPPEPEEPSVSEADFSCVSSSSSSSSTDIDPGEQPPESPNPRPPDPEPKPRGKPLGVQSDPLDASTQQLTPTFDPEPSWNAFWRRWERGTHKTITEPEAREWWFEHVRTPEYAVQIVDGLIALLASEQWTRGVGIPYPFNFLSKHYYRRGLPPPQPSKREQDNDRLRAWARHCDEEIERQRGGDK